MFNKVTLSNGKEVPTFGIGPESEMATMKIRTRVLGNILAGHAGRIIPNDNITNINPEKISIPEESKLRSAEIMAAATFVKAYNFEDGEDLLFPMALEISVDLKERGRLLPVENLAEAFTLYGVEDSRSFWWIFVTRSVEIAKRKIEETNPDKNSYKYRKFFGKNGAFAKLIRWVDTATTIDDVWYCY